MIKAIKISLLVLLLTCLPLVGLAQSPAKGMRPRVLMGDSSHCKSVHILDGHLVSEDVCTKGARGEVAWDGRVAVISATDERASSEWMRVHSVLPHLSTKHHDLYWDGKKVNLGKVDVYNLYEAFLWERGVMIYGRTIPRRGFWGSWPFKGPFIEARDIEPFCAIYFDLDTMKGEDLWLNGKAYLGFVVFPLPD